MENVLPRSAFSDLLRPREFSFSLSENVSGDTLSGGGAVRVSTGTRLWQGRVEIVRQSREDARTLDAAFDRVTSASGGFLISPPACRPLHDPEGSALIGATLTLAAVVDGGATVTISGLPEGYVLAAGDFVGWTYGAPARRGLHRILSTVSAGQDGQAEVEILPRTPASSGAPVTLIDPVMRAVVVPGTYSDSDYVPGLRGTRSFRFRQVLP